MSNKQLSKTMMRFAGEPAHYCPACDQMHVIHVTRKNCVGAKWSWNNDSVRPTFSPSINIHGRCHYFLKEGQLEYLPDSKHALAGKTVPLPELPGWIKS